MSAFGTFIPSAQFTRPPSRGHLFLFRQHQLYLTQAGELPASVTFEELCVSPQRVQFLGELEGQPCFSAELAPEARAPSEGAFHDLRQLHGVLGELRWVLAGRALQIVEWDRTHQFCGACGAVTEPHPRERCRVCTRCRLQLFPRLAPAMIVCVERGPEVLLARGRHFPPGVYSTLAGFVDPGESLEDCVHREVFEETGVRIGNLRYFKSQPWPFPHSLMLGFFADHVGGQIAPQPDEIEDAAFFHVDRLPRLFPGLVSVGNQLLANFCARHGRPFPGA